MPEFKNEFYVDADSFEVRRSNSKAKSMKWRASVMVDIRIEEGNWIKHECFAYGPTKEKALMDLVQIAVIDAKNALTELNSPESPCEVAL